MPQCASVIKHKDDASLTYKFPRLPIPLTIAILTERLAGGRGIALETHTAVSAKPKAVNMISAGRVKGHLASQFRLTRVATCHEEHSDVTATDGRRGKTNNVA